MQEVKIYSDGACSGNPGPGGWGAILQCAGKEKLVYGALKYTTNNQMELMAIIEALKALKKTAIVKVYTDSKYVKHGITEWIKNWRRNNWRNSANKPVKNQALWEELDALCQKHEVKWYWIKGHAGHVENERADELARLAIKNLKI